MRSAQKRSAATGGGRDAGRPLSPGAPSFGIHTQHIWAADFLTVPTVRFQTLYVFFLITHGRRRLVQVHLNVTAHPTAEWVWRQLIQATPWGEQPRYLIRHRDRCYSGSFIPRAARLGIDTLLTPVQAPKVNAIAERLVGTLRRECLDHFILINERHLRLVLKEYAAHHNRGRPHRALDLVPRAGSSRSLHRVVAASAHGRCRVAYCMNTSGRLPKRAGCISGPYSHLCFLVNRRESQPKPDQLRHPVLVGIVPASRARATRPGSGETAPR